MSKAFILSLCSVVMFLLGVLYGSREVGVALSDRMLVMDKQTYEIAQQAYTLGCKLGCMTYHITTNRANVDRLIAVGWQNGAAEYHRIINDHQTNSKSAN